MKNVEEATLVRHKILYAFEVAERIMDPVEGREWLTFVIVGAGPTGVKLAGAIAEMLRDAGSKTPLPLPKDTVAKTYNRAGVYNGGWVATYCIDMMIQQDTNGKKDLYDLFRLLLDRYGLTGKQYTTADLAQSASEVAGIDLSYFFATYIATPKTLPVQECLKDGGYDSQILNYAGEAFVVPSHTATELEKSIRNRLSVGSQN